jgi:YfiH family protein
VLASGPAQEASELVRRVFGDGRSAACLRQEHGVSVWRVRGRAPLERAGDGLSTDDPELALGVQTADCVPILIADRRLGAVAALHAGWRGTAAGIVPRALEHLCAEYGSHPRDLQAVLGPAIGACCYEVGEEVREAVMAGPLGRLAEFHSAPGGRWTLGLARLNAACLEAAGVDPRRVRLLAGCTRCRGDRLYSFRGEGPNTGRNWSFIAPPGAPGALTRRAPAPL